MTNRSTLFAIGAALALTSSVASAQNSLRSHHISAAGDAAVIVVAGSSGCAPPAAAAEQDGNDIVVRLAPLPPGTACFSAPRPWGVTVNTPDLAPGEYEVAVRWGESTLGTFSFDWPLAGVTDTAHASFVPTEGMWWSSDQPGTGMALNVDDQGRWFAALYLYDELGAPTFLTLQGEALTYDFDGPPRRAYAVGVSPIIRSEGGQCLQCPWREPTIEATEDDAILEFQGRNRASLTVGGTWRMNLTPLPMMAADVIAQRVVPIDDRHYLLTIDASDARHVVTVRAEVTASAGNLPPAIFHCVDCRSTGEDGAGNEALDAQLKALVEQQLLVRCSELECRVLDGWKSGHAFIDLETGTISAWLRDIETPAENPMRIELRLLPEGWRE